MKSVPAASWVLVGLGLFAAFCGLGAAGWLAYGQLGRAEPIVEKVYAPIDSPYGHVTPEPVAAVLGPEPEPLDFQVDGDGLLGDGAGGNKLLVGRDGRIYGVATATPEPTNTPEPTATLIPRPTRGPSAVAEWIELPEGWVELNCDQRFRQALLDWAGTYEEFEVVLVAELAEGIKAEPDCMAAGWNPVFDFRTGCPGIYRTMDGIHISSDLRVTRFETRDPFLGPTGMDERGNILVHFRRLPSEEVMGCWYYAAAERTWVWSGPDPAYSKRRREGREPYSFPECGYMLRRHLAGFVGESMTVADVVRLKDRVRLNHPQQCGHESWSGFPQLGPREYCQPAAATGFDSSGELLVVNWHERFPARDGAVCWVLQRGQGVWWDYYPDGE